MHLQVKILFQYPTCIGDGFSLTPDDWLASDQAQTNTINTFNQSWKQQYIS